MGEARRGVNAKVENGRDSFMDRVIYDSSKKRRVTIFKCEDGSFSFLEEHFSDEPLEHCWIPLTHRRSIPVCDSFETATREAAGRIEWLGAILGQG